MQWGLGWANHVVNADHLREMRCQHRLMFTWWQDTENYVVITDIVVFIVDFAVVSVTKSRSLPACHPGFSILHSALFMASFAHLSNYMVKPHYNEVHDGAKNIFLHWTLFCIVDASSNGIAVKLSRMLFTTTWSQYGHLVSRKTQSSLSLQINKWDTRPTSSQSDDLMWSFDLITEPSHGVTT